MIKNSIFDFKIMPVESINSHFQSTAELIE